MIRYDKNTLSEYLDKLALREPVPGGGSAAALAAALGAALVEMVAKYSLGKGKPKPVEKKLVLIDRKAGALRKELLALVSGDAEAYLGIVAARKKDKTAQKKANSHARKVCQQIRMMSLKGLALLPYLKEEGNPWLQSDVEAAQHFFASAVQTADVMIKANA